MCGLSLLAFKWFCTRSDVCVLMAAPVSDPIKRKGRGGISAFTVQPCGRIGLDFIECASVRE